MKVDQSLLYTHAIMESRYLRLLPLVVPIDANRSSYRSRSLPRVAKVRKDIDIHLVPSPPF